MDSPPTSALTVDSLAGSREGVRILKVHGPLLISNFFEFQQMTRDDRSPIIIIDLEDVPYMDSAALGSLLGVHVSTGRKKNKYAIINVPERILSMFTISGVRETLVIFPTLAQAEAALL